MEFDFCLYDSNRRKIVLSVDPLGPPWITRFIAFVHLAVRSRGGDIDGIERMEALVRNHPSFEEVVSQDIWMPTTPQGENSSGILENNLVRCFTADEPLVDICEFVGILEVGYTAITQLWSFARTI